MTKLSHVWISVAIVAVTTAAVSAQSFRVQCPPMTITHPLTGNNCSTNPTNPGCNNTEPAYAGPTQFSQVPINGTQGGYLMPTKGTVNGAIKCQQISGGDGYSTMGDGTQTFMFSFGPLSGLADIAAGRTGAEVPYIFNTAYPGTGSSSVLVRGDPATTDGAASGAQPWGSWPSLITPSPTDNPIFNWNGAVGLAPEITNIDNVTNLVEGAIPAGSTAPGCATTTANTVTAWTDAPLGLPLNSQVVISNVVAEGGAATPAGYAGTWTVSCVGTGAALGPDGFEEYAFQYIDSTTGLAADTGNGSAASAASPAAFDGHVDPRPIMDVGVMNGNIPAPLQHSTRMTSISSLSPTWA